MKKGSLAKTDAGETALVDESQKAYKVDGAIVSVWEQCDGAKTKDQIIDEFAKNSTLEKNQINDAVSLIFTRLEEAGLIQKVE